MASRCLLSSLLFLWFIPLATGAALANKPADEWPPISPEELAMKEYPASPGAPAIILYREMHTDGVKHFETHYRRIKIFTEEGKKHANVEIPYLKGKTRIKEIKARTVHPDGTVVAFTGDIFEKVVVKYKKLKILVKSFTLPDVRVGSIIEYKYSIRWGSNLRFLPTQWFIEHELFTRQARFSLRPYQSIHFSAMSTGFRISKSKLPKLQADGSHQMELENISAFQEEEHIPPETELKMWVLFYYLHNTWGGSPEGFWKETGMDLHQKVEKFIGKRKAIAKEAARTVQPNDPPETKLRKLYARVHQIRNLSCDRKSTERDEKLRKNKNVKDVLKRGYGRPWHINWLFVALARAAGFDATAVRVASRSNGFFKRKLFDASQLNADLVLVRHGGKEYYLDPANRYCPFRLLSWDQTGVQGIRLAEDGGEFVTTPLPLSSHTMTGRKANLQLGTNGSLQGTVEVSFTGQEALRRRLDAIETDEVGRRKEMEEEVKGWLPAGASAEQQSVTGWEGTEEPLKAEFAVRIPNFGTSTGRRLILPVAIFQANEKHPFPHDKRVHPIYFPYPWQEVDEITVQLPEGYKAESLPKKRTSRPKFGKYEISYEDQGRTLRLQRSFAMGAIWFPVEHYPSLRLFFDAVRSGDEQQVVLQAVETDSQD